MCFNDNFEILEAYKTFAKSFFKQSFSNVGVLVRGRVDSESCVFFFFCIPCFVRLVILVYFQCVKKRQDVIYFGFK